MDEFTIIEHWKYIEKNICPKNAHILSKRELKRAFYSGCSASLGIMGRISTLKADEGSKILANLYKEIEEFNIALKNREE